MVIGIEGYRHLVAAKRKLADMVPGAIDPPELYAIHIDMRMAVTFGIVASGGGGVEGEIGRDHIQVPATDRIRIDGGIKGRRGGPVIDRNQRFGLHGMLAAG